MFELLEDFADNVSFCSNSSVVSRLIKQGRDDKNMLNMEGVKAVIEAKKEQLLEKQDVENLEWRGVNIQTEDKNNSLIAGVDLESSSDTLTDSSSSDSLDDDEEFDLVTAPSNDVVRDKNVRASYEALFEQSPNAGFVFVNNRGNSDSDPFRSSESEIRISAPLSPTKSITRKIAVKESSESSDTQTMLKRLAASVNEVRAPTKMSVSANSETQAFVNEMFHGNNVDIANNDVNSDDSDTELDDSHIRVTSPAFDDEEEWTVSAPQTQVAVLDLNGTNAKPDGTPPTSRLVARLFPQLKNANQARQIQKIEQEQQKLQDATNKSIGDGFQSRVLRDKLAELEKEIEQFRNENSNLEKLRREREESLGTLKQEIKNFEGEKTDELKRIEEFRAQETKKLKHERKLFEQYQKTIRSMPDKRDREEIEALKRQLSELQDEVKKKEGRWTSANNRLRQRVELLDMENKELKEEIKLLEKHRLETMQRNNQKKNGVQKSFPRSNTEAENSSLSEKNLNMNNHERLSFPNQSSTLNSSNLSHLSNRPAHNISGDAMPRGHPAPVLLPHAEEGKDLASSADTVVNALRKQSDKFIHDHPAIDKGDKEYEETQYPDGKVERQYSNGAREILFANGTRKEISSDGESIVVSFFNGDMKQIFPDQRVVYFYSDAQTTHTTYPDGLEILQFQNNQIEKHYPDGTNEITFPDQTIKYLFPNGSEESIFPDGTVIRVEKSGDKTMEFPNGQREIHTESYKRREYPDGTVKTVYPDGRQETRYSTGRIRLKDKDGNVIVDKMC